jgi:hypothetical protein
LGRSSKPAALAPARERHVATHRYDKLGLEIPLARIEGPHAHGHEDRVRAHGQNACPFLSPACRNERVKKKKSPHPLAAASRLHYSILRRQVSSYKTPIGKVSGEGESRGY